MKSLFAAMLFFTCINYMVTVTAKVTGRKPSNPDMKKELMAISKLINDLMKRDDREVRILLRKNGRKLAEFGKVVQENGILTSNNGRVYSKIAHQLGHSANLINEIIQRQKLMNSQLEHLAMVQKYINGL